MGHGAAGTQAARVASTISPMVSTDSSLSGLLPEQAARARARKTSTTTISMVRYFMEQSPLQNLTVAIQIRKYTH
jgi:pyruvoyl-dependent arginine decarboxylase (PvlArgDC)